MKTYVEIKNGGVARTNEVRSEKVDGLDLHDLGAPKSFYARRGKRVLDLLVSTSALLVLAPCFFVVALVLRLSLGKEIIFHQGRVGLMGAGFDCLKFRTMDPDRRAQQLPYSGPERRNRHKGADDPRHTPVGRFLRKYSLDEVPQLLNVVRGEMSLVGPRPEMLARASEQFLEHPRHWVRPGLTGPFQISDLRLTGDLTLGLRKDAEYVGSLSFSGDVVLLLRTMAVVFSGSGE